VSSLQQLNTDLTNFASPFASIQFNAESSKASPRALSQCVALMQSKSVNATGIPAAASKVVSDFQKLVSQAITSAGTDTVTQAAQQVNTVLTQVLKQIDQGSEIFAVDPGQVFSTLSTTLSSLANVYNTLKNQAATLLVPVQAILQALGSPQQIRASYDYDDPSSNASRPIFRSGSKILTRRGIRGSSVALCLQG
jgi:hypothetical protein